MADPSKFAWARALLVGAVLALTPALLVAQGTYRCRCVDGTYSNSCGHQGACSHHGGIDPNQPTPGPPPATFTPPPGRVTPTPTPAPRQTPIGGAGCATSLTQLCLNRGRFSVSSTWQEASGTGGVGSAVQLTDDTGYFWFFDDSNTEIVVKVLDACSTSARAYWVFAAGLTNLGVTMTVYDTLTGRTRHYSSPVNRPFAPIQDTEAFEVCPR